MAMDGTMTPADVVALTKDNDGFLGGGAGGILALIIVFILLFGNGAWGFGGSNGVANYATQADIQRGFDYSNIDSKLSSIGNGICSLGYDQLNQMNAINTNVMQTGATLSSAINDVGYQVQNGFCGVNRNIDSVRFDAQLNTRSITDAIHAEGEATRNLITENTIQQLREDLQSAQLTLANANQTRNITSEILGSLGRYVTNPSCAYQCSCGNGVTIA